MKILFINSFHHPGGGDRTYMFNLASLLEENGHKIAYFAMNHKKNIASEYSDFFLEEIDFKKAFNSKKPRNIIKVLTRSIYSLEAKKKLELLLTKFKPDIAHLHTIHNHISPSILHTLKNHDIPIVWTLHIYSLICPNSMLCRNGKICEDCKINKYYKAIIKRCIKNSYAASFVGTIASYTHHFLKLYDLVDIYLCPSEFLRNKYIEYDFDPQKMIVLRNFIDVYSIKPSYSTHNYGLFAGRLVKEKGLLTLIRALKLNKQIKFKIVGEGPLKNELITYCKKNGVTNVKFLGFKSKKELFKLYKMARFTVLPSECYENCPMAIIESFAFGKPVIGSNIGGIPEMIKDGINGFIFKAGDYYELSKKINLIYNSEYNNLAKNARLSAEKFYNKKEHYLRIIKIYKSLVE